MAQTIDTEALHQAHSAGIEIRPDRLAAMGLFGAKKGLRYFVQRIVPGNLLKFAARLVADPPQRLRHAAGMVYALGIAGDLGAYYAGSVIIVARAAHLADGAVIKPFNFERTGTGAIMRAYRTDKWARNCGHGAYLRLLSR